MTTRHLCGTHETWGVAMCVFAFRIRGGVCGLSSRAFLAFCARVAFADLVFVSAVAFAF